MGFCDIARASDVVFCREANSQQPTNCLTFLCKTQFKAFAYIMQSFVNTPCNLSQCDEFIMVT